MSKDIIEFLVKVQLIVLNFYKSNFHVHGGADFSVVYHLNVLPKSTLCWIRGFSKAPKVLFNYYCLRFKYILSDLSFCCYHALKIINGCNIKYNRKLDYFICVQLNSQSACADNDMAYRVIYTDFVLHIYPTCYFLLYT